MKLCTNTLQIHQFNQVNETTLIRLIQLYTNTLDNETGLIELHLFQVVDLTASWRRVTVQLTVE